MTVLVTGAAGFIGSHAVLALLARGETVIGVDNLNDYYDPALKQARLDRCRDHPAFTFQQVELSDRAAVDRLFAAAPAIDRVIHLAAQAGVRYSLQNPYAYVDANVMGQLTLLEACRHRAGLKHFVYASSSSVYGGNTKLPFAIEDPVTEPVSLYAATKRAGELMAHTYGHLYRLPSTGLRFFTVYGPWGRPDMAAWLFTDAILAGRPIRVFNHGDMRRDFTFVADAVAGLIAALDRPPEDPGTGHGVPCRLYNIGNHRSEPLPRFIAIIEAALGRKADMSLEPIQPGDVKETYADIDAARRDLGFQPSTPIDVGLPQFVEWYLDYHNFK